MNFHVISNNFNNGHHTISLTTTNIEISRYYERMVTGLTFLPKLQEQVHQND